MKLKSLSLLALLAIFLLSVVLINQLGSRARLDLTEQGLYTLSDGSRKILAEMKQPLEIQLFFSQQASKDLTRLRAYATQVEELLNEYVLHSNDMLSLQVIDPEPFSEQEDLATELGLQAVPVSGFGDELYFGLAVKQLTEEGERDVAVLPFLQPDKEAFLEYDVTQLIYQLQQSRAPVIGLLSGLDVRGGFNPQSGQPTPAWMAIEQLDRQYEVRSLSAELETIEADVDVLMLIQPPALSDQALYAIDQFALRGGRVLAFLDPLAESATASPMAMADPASATSLNPLLKSWGVQWDADQVVLDAANALVVNQGRNRPPLRHFALLSLGQDDAENNSVVTAQLESINLASAGHWLAAEDAQSEVKPWLFSSADAQLTDANRLRINPDLVALQRGFVASGEHYNLGVRVSGSASTAFPEGVNGKKVDDHRAATKQLAVTLVADTDLLTDRLWVQVQNFFGQRIASPWADNGNLLINLTDQLAGSPDLIDLRARGQYARPFSKVEALQRAAEERFLASEQRLQQRLQETERQLAELQQQKDAEDSVLTLSDEQQAALENFQRQKVEIRKELRAVQHELDKDIEALGSQLKVLNIFILPLLLTLFSWLLALLLRRRQQL
ncbi:Gldg family protein [Bacterioplanoides pacificum]|uniref:Gldg family protein n=1 Tax=Bacterioplanoides pacificum TaxID=1171596 RepID=A0ABV7VN54_9GAMM